VMLVPSTLEGTVKTSGGEAVPGAEVTLLSADGVRYATTDETGTYAFGNLAPDVYDVTVVLAPYKAASEVGISIGSAMNITSDFELPDIDWTMSPANTVLAAGSHFSLYVDPDGTAWSWGYNGNGQLGIGSTSHYSAPVRVNGLQGVVSVAAGTNHAVALTSDGQVWSWGNNAYGQLGDTTTTQRNAPVLVTGLPEIIAVSAGDLFTLALDSGGNVWSWGYNGSGQLGDGTTTNRTAPMQIPSATLSDVIAIAAGPYFAAALKHDGTVWTWGYNGYGQLGDGTTTNRTIPTQVGGLANGAAIAAGDRHILVLKQDGTVWTWGNNSNGQLGDRTSTSRRSPAMALGLTNVKRIAAGSQHSIAVKEDGTLWTWGSNNYGQLGDGTTTDRWSPSRSKTLADITEIGLRGDLHSLALGHDGDVWAWGRNNTGQLGNGTTVTSLTPVSVVFIPKVTVTAGVGRVTVAGAQPGATIKLYDATNSVFREAVADGSGGAEFSSLPAGQTYRATQTINGVESALSEAAVVLGDAPNPVISLLGESTVRVIEGAVYVDDGATAVDDEDGSITEWITVGGTFADTSTPGIFTITYNVSDSDGNAAAEITRTVEVAPQPVTVASGVGSIAVSGAYPGAFLKLYDADAATVFGETTANEEGAAVFANVPPGQPFHATQTVNGVESNPSVEVAAVAESDTEAPILNLNGLDVVRVAVGELYEDEGAAAYDEADGDLTGSIVTGGTFVGTEAIGTFVIIYYVTDAAGNEATPVTRTVQVVPAPVTAVSGHGSIIVVGAEPDAGLRLYDTVTSAVYAEVYANSFGSAVFAGLTPGNMFAVTQTVNGLESDPTAAIVVLEYVLPLQPMLINAQTSSDGTRIVLTYDKALQPSAIDKGKFSVVVNGVAATVTEAENEGNVPYNVILTLADPVAYDDEIWLSAEDGAVQGIEGYPSAPSDVSVTNATALPLSEQVRQLLRQSDPDQNGIGIGDILFWLRGHVLPDLNGDGVADGQDLRQMLQWVEPIAFES
ncbi:immunoglobulin-like domain-containing protein, partial [Paenibacillus sp.]|uniref:RCC1 domain-containing protein n=1 Tax=Paenibacillus sp. TaxID=58172 RepID=UPI002D4FAF34